MSPASGLDVHRKAFLSYSQSSNLPQGADGICILSLVPQSRAARQLMERTQSSNMETRLDAMKELAKLSADVTFATEFINMDGIIVLTRLVESGTKLLSQ